MASERQTTSALARSLLDLCRSRKLTIATAESCTGGL
ncbi:MAG TPA: CinA family protein, partial [Bradyrhizobium sp.]|nr:CinA family protein [Bradyrhizobium sp.]